MHCQSCGAENEPDARFCAECGAPLGNQVDTQLADDDDGDDQTILSIPSPVSEEAKTLSVTQEQVAEAAVEAESEPPLEAEAASPPPPTGGPPAGGDGGSNDDGLFSQRNIIIAVIVLVVLCCCCFALSIGVGALSGAFEEIQRELTALSVPIII